MSFFLGREGNRITIGGEFGIQDVRKVFAVAHQTIEDRGHNELIFDFSYCTAAFPGAMLPLCTYIMNLVGKRFDVDIKLPQDERIAGIFRRSGWAHYMCPRYFDFPQISFTSRQHPAVLYSTHEQQEEILNTLLEKLLAVIPNFNRAAFAAVEWALNEISDNVLNHSGSAIGGLLQLAVFDSSRQKVEFTVSDAGVGVPVTLRAAKPEITNDVDGLLQAVKSGVTRNPQDFQGNGLYGTLEICRVGGGKFSLNSGNAVLICGRDGVVARRDPIPFTGATIDAHIDFSEPNLLEKALAIDGKVHKPVDYIELKYETDGLTHIPFNLEEHAFSYRSRPAGRPVRVKLSNVVEACPGQTVIIDFGGITVVSSSFADEVFGKLFIELGPMKFMQSVKLINVTPTVQALIDRAITQRMQQPTIDPRD